MKQWTIKLCFGTITQISGVFTLLACWDKHAAACKQAFTVSIEPFIFKAVFCLLFRKPEMK